MGGPPSGEDVMGGRWIGMAAALAVGLVWAAEARRITVTASKPDLLYSQKDPDCNELSKTPDAALPFYITRLRVTPPSGVSPADVRYEWQPPSAGALAADQDLGPDR